MSTRKIVTTDKITPPRVPLSHAVKVGNLVYVSGTTPFKPGTFEMAPDFEGQMHQVMSNIGTILDAAGSSLERVVKMNVILVDIGNFKEMNAIYGTYFKEGNYPARTTIEAKLASPGMMLEIECVAEA
jgi:2-iminobutanoate/2-iminopropanoate deaminase